MASQKYFTLGAVLILGVMVTEAFTGQGFLIASTHPKKSLLSSNDNEHLKVGQELEEYDDSSEEEANCTRLAPNSARTSVLHENQISFTNLVDGGFDHMVNTSGYKDVMLILGNTGVGKSTMAQIIAGDLNRIHAVLTHTNKLVIVDDADRISAPSVLSRTLVPELVVKTDTKGINGSSSTLAIYDCPGFDDTRGPAQDVGASFFMNQIVSKVARVKMLFLVLHSSVELGYDRLDFDLLAHHSTKFVKNMTNFKDSVGLVVTKVKSYSHNGKYKSDRSIMKNIVAFLLAYKQTLYSSLNSEQAVDPEERDSISKKLEFVNILVETNAEGQYTKITFSRDPEKCGPLSGSLEVASTKKRVAELYEGLEFSSVGNHTENFGFTLKFETILKITNSYIADVNDGVIAKITKVVENFKTWLDNVKLSWTTNNITSAASELNEVVVHTISGLSRIITKVGGLNNSTNSTISAVELGAVIQTELVKIGYYPSLENIETFMEQQDALLEFFDKVVGTNKVERRVRDWKYPLTQLKVRLMEYQSWYSFCTELQNVMHSYDFQVRKTIVGSSIGQMDWLEFIELHNIFSVGQNIKSIGTSFGLESKQIQLLNETMEYALHPTTITCTSYTYTVQGHFVLFTEFMQGNNNVHFPSQCSHFIRDKGYTIEMYAANTVFIDTNFNGVGLEINLVVIAPKWQVVGDERYLKLDGEDGSSDASPKKASNGITHNMYRAGSDGENGRPGIPGGPGGSFFGLASQIINGNKLEISANGGKGGNGQNGGDGGNGNEGMWPTRGDTERTGGINLLVVKTEYRQFSGNSGYAGGHGGNGGIGGLGGLPGHISILSQDKSDVAVRKSNKRGDNGNSGIGGKGGQGGPAGSATVCKYVSVFFIPFKDSCTYEQSNNVAGRNGRNGIDNFSRAGIQFPAAPNYEIVEWKSLSSFKTKFDQFSTIDWNEFVETEIERFKLYPVHEKINQEMQTASRVVERNFIEQGARTIYAF